MKNDLIQNLNGSIGTLEKEVLQIKSEQSKLESIGKTSEIEQKRTKDGKIIQPSQHSSVVVMMSEHGLEVFSPGATAELGQGEKLLTQPVEHEQRIGEGINDKKSHGGIRLIGWFF